MPPPESCGVEGVGDLLVAMERLFAQTVGALAPEVRQEIRAAASTVIQNLD